MTVHAHLARALVFGLVLAAGWSCTDSIVSVIPVAVVDVQPQTATRLVGESVQLVAHVRDADGNALTGRTVRWTSETSAVASVDAAGLVRALAPGEATIAATSEGVRGTARITVIARPQIRLDTDSALFLVKLGSAAAPDTVAITNSGGSTLTGLAAAVEYGTGGTGWLQVRLSSTTAPATLEVAPQSAALAAGTYRATVRVSADVAGNSPRALGVRLEVARPAIAALELVEGDAQSATVNTDVPQAPRVRARDADGEPLAGVAVTWAVVAGGGSLGSTAPVLTGADGSAAAPAWRLGQVAGQNTLTATADGLPTAPVTFTATGLPGAAVRLAFQTAPPTVGRSSVPLAPQPAIQLIDAFGNAVPSAGVTVSAAIASGGGDLFGTTSVLTTVAGVASFADLAITGAVGERVLVFSAPGLQALESAPIAISAGTAARIGIVQQPSGTASAGAPFTVQPIVQLLDGEGNAAAEAGVAVTAGIASGGGVLSGTLTVVTDAAGRASFTNLAITGLIGPRTLRFSAPGLAAAISDTIQLGAGAAAVLAITTQPPVTMSSGVVFSRAPVVQLRDVGGNAVAQAGVPVTVAIASGGGTLGGTLTVGTGSSGAATFADLWIAGTAGDRTLEFTANGLGAVTSSAIAITTGTGTQLSLTVQPSALVQSGVVFQRQPVVQLRDAGGNAVPQAGVLVTAVIRSGGGTLEGTASVITSSAGTAAFTDLAVSGLVGERVLEFTASGITPVASEPVTVAAGPAAALSITVQPSASAQSGVVLPQQPVVQLRDGAGNAVSEAGVSVEASIASGGGTLGGVTTIATSSAGVATFTDLAISGLVGPRTLRFSAAGLTAATSAGITLVAGPVALDQASASVPNGVAGAQTLITIQLRDASGNPVSGEAGSLAVVVSGANPTNLAVVDDGGGAYSARYTPALTGTDVIAITFAGAPVPGSPFSSSVRPGGVSATGSSVSIAPAAGVVANGSDAYEVTVVLRDTLGNPVGGLADAFAVTAGSGPAIEEVVETLTVGTYMFRITSTLAGSFAMVVTVGGTALAAQPNLEFVAGPVAGNESSIGVSRTTGVLADGMDPAVVTVQLRDAFDNPVSGLADASFTITLASASGQAARTSVTPTLNPGEYTFSVTNERAEVVTLTIVAAGVQLGSQPTIEFVPGAVSSTVSTVSANPLSVTANGADSIIVTVNLRDAFGNAIPGAAAAFSIAAGSATAGAVTETATAGTYRFGLASTVAQSANVQVTVSGVLLSTQPAVQFTTGVVSASLSTVTADPTSVEANGTAASVVTVTLRDAQSNLVSGATLSISAPGATAGTVTETATGVYSFSVTSSTAGAVTVTVTANGVVLNTAPVVNFVAGAISASLSSATASPATGVTANGTAASTVTVQLRDGSGNPITGVAAGEFTIGATLGTAGAVTETGGGAYTFTVTSTTAGTATVTIAARGVTLSQQPTIGFVAGAISASVSTVTANPASVVADGVSASTITVTLRDANGNLVSGVAAGEFTLVVSGGTAGAIAETGVGTGIYTFPVTSTVAGPATVTVTARGTQLSTEPAITFTAGGVDATRSSILVPGTPVVVGNGG